MNPRIAFVFRRSSVFFSIENIFRNIIRQMASRSCSAGYSWDTREEVVPRIGLKPSSILANARFVQRLKGDVFHVTGDIHYLALFLPRQRTILTIHDCVFMYQSRGLKKWILERVMLKWPVRHCQWITCVSEQTKKDILRFGRCDEKKVKVIPNPVNGQISHLPRPFREDCPVLLFMGTTSNKNLPRVIDALQGIPCILDIVGRLDPSTEAVLKGSGITYRNSYGLIEEEVFAKYACADIVLFPSLFEGFGMPIVEGQKAGRPVITSQISPMMEVAGGGACLVDPQSSSSIRAGILKVIRDPAYREQLIAAGLENSRRFEVEAVTQQYEELYKNIIEKTGISA